MADQQFRRNDLLVASMPPRMRGRPQRRRAQFRRNDLSVDSMVLKRDKPRRGVLSQQDASNGARMR